MPRGRRSFQQISNTAPAFAERLCIPRPASTGFQTERTSTEDLEPGGFITDYDHALHVPLNVRVNGAFTATFPGAQPAIGDTVTITTNGTGSYKVGRTGHTQDGLELVLGLRTLGR